MRATASLLLVLMVTALLLFYPLALRLIEAWQTLQSALGGGA